MNKGWLWAVAFVVAATPVKAWTDHGFMTMGGVGGVACPDFINAMATARQLGGFDTSPGINVVNPFVQYVNGFGTAYNLAIPNMYDLFDSLRPDAGMKLLFLIEPWCRENPGSKFENGVMAQINVLVPKAAR